jgi:hypothetical protein
MFNSFLDASRRADSRPGSRFAVGTIVVVLWPKVHRSKSAPIEKCTDLNRIFLGWTIARDVLSAALTPDPVSVLS